MRFIIELFVAFQVMLCSRCFLVKSWVAPYLMRVITEPLTTRLLLRLVWRLMRPHCVFHKIFRDMFWYVQLLFVCCMLYASYCICLFSFIVSQLYIHAAWWGISKSKKGLQIQDIIHYILLKDSAICVMIIRQLFLCCIRNRCQLYR